MTPLFHAIAQETTKPVKERRLVDPAGYARRLGEFHFFDCTAVAQAGHDLGGQFVAAGRVPSRTAFLPAPKTALEVSVDGMRCGVLIEEDGERAHCRFVVGADGAFVIEDLVFSIALRDEASEWFWIDGHAPEDRVRQIEELVPAIYGMLALINSPRIIGRKQHLPHAGLQRKLAAARGMVGKFPLHGWTEIQLSVTPPVTVPGEREARLSGDKALHFVRQHLRIVGGVLVRIAGKPVMLGGKEVLVKAHWRGDPALGIKQTRYRLVA